MRFFKVITAPVLMAIFPILSFYLANISQLSIKFLVTPLSYSVGVSLIFVIAFVLTTKNLAKSVLITTLLLFIFYSYGHVSRFLDNKLFIQLSNNFVLGPDKILLPFLLVLNIFVIIKIIKSNRDVNSLIRFINLTLVILVALSVIRISIYEQQKNRLGNLYVDQTQSSQNFNQTAPDIYYIILDGYARQDVLKNLYEYDNSEFIGTLRKMGFYVADHARSNYIHTYLSLPSSLNMTYLDSLAEKYGNKPADDYAAMNLVRHNVTAEKLKKYGYQSINFETWWAGTDKNYPADITYRYEKTYKILGINLLTDEVNMVFLQTTLLNPLIREVRNEVLRGRIITVFEKLPAIPYMKSRKFTLAHITAPHPPYVFMADGSSVSDADLESGDEGIDKRPKYLEQLKYVSNQIIPVLQKLISNSQTPPVIILQSDHGPASIFGSRNDWVDNYSEQGFWERNSILYAVYLPDKDYSQFYDTITPVNTFRIIFNKYFEENLNILPDKVYYTNYNSMYDFKEINN